MNNESAIQNYLDTTEGAYDLDARRVLGDFLEDHDDVRANGYRALGILGVHCYGGCDGTWFTAGIYTARPPRDVSNLPHDWFDLLEGGTASKGVYQDHEIEGYAWIDYPNRREAEDAAAVAFSKLPPDRQTYYLSGTAIW